MRFALVPMNVQQSHGRLLLLGLAVIAILPFAPSAQPHAVAYERAHARDNPVISAVRGFVARLRYYS
jgi:hypothetical protein